MITLEELPKYEKALGYSLDTLKAMQLGEIKDIVGTENKIKRHEDNLWIFLRFDSVHTHLIKHEGSSEDTYDIWQRFREACDYGVKYGKDRCDAISKTFNDDAAVRTVSSNKFMNQQVKTKGIPLSGENGFTKTLETIADFICYARFDNKEQEDEHEELKKERLRLEKIKKNKRKEYQEQRLTELKEIPKSYAVRMKNSPDNFEVTSLERIIEENNGIVDKKNLVQYSNTKFKPTDLKVLEGFLNGDFKVSHEPHSKLKAIVLRQFQDEINLLETKPFTPERAKQISWLKGEMHTADENMSRSLSATPVVDIEETISHDSWNHLSYRNIETYKALLEGYYESEKKYKEKPNTSFWAVLEDFKNLLDNTEWNKEEKLIIDYIMDTGITEHKQIQEELLRELDFKISKMTLSKWLNNNIPTKIFNTYEKQLENWIWIERRKGQYKTCSKCGETKLAVDSRYFRNDITGKLGLRSQCRKCENS